MSLLWQSGSHIRQGRISSSGPVPVSSNFLGDLLVTLGKAGNESAALAPYLVSSNFLGWNMVSRHLLE